MGLEQTVVGLRQPVVPVIPPGLLWIIEVELALDGERQRLEAVGRRGGAPFRYFGRMCGAPAHRESPGHPRGLAGDIAGGVADAQPARSPSKPSARLVVVRVDLLAVEVPGSLHRGSQWWPLHRLARRRSGLAVVGVTSHPSPARRSTEVTSVRKVIESRSRSSRRSRRSTRDLGVVRVVGDSRGHRERRVGHPAPRGVDEERPVGGRHPRCRSRSASSRPPSPSRSSRRGCRARVAPGGTRRCRGAGADDADLAVRSKGYLPRPG